MVASPPLAALLGISGYHPGALPDVLLIVAALCIVALIC